MPQLWIGRRGVDLTLGPCPAGCPDLTTCGFFLWGYVTDKVHFPPRPANNDDKKDRITAANNTVDHDMLRRLWEEFPYRLDVVRVAGGAH